PDVSIIRSAAGVPAPMVPGECLVGCDGPIFQLANEGVNAFLLAIRPGLVPVVVIRVMPKEAVIRANIAPEIWVVGPGAVHHDALRFDFLACFVAVIFSQIELSQVHSFSSLPRQTLHIPDKEPYSA